MTTNLERAADLLDAWSKDGGELNSHVGSPTEIARMLAAAGLITPDMPEPARDNHRGEPIWETEGHTQVSTTGPLPISLSGPFGEGWDMYPIEAEDIALALLAAARHARNTKENHDD